MQNIKKIIQVVSLFFIGILVIDLHVISNQIEFCMKNWYNVYFFNLAINLYTIYDAILFIIILLLVVNIVIVLIKIPVKQNNL